MSAARATLQQRAGANVRPARHPQRPRTPATKPKRDFSLRDPAHKKRAQEKAGSLRSE